MLCLCCFALRVVANPRIIRPGGAEVARLPVVSVKRSREFRSPRKSERFYYRSCEMEAFSGNPPEVI
jgi:hypothetical protein